jgi:hypothetical protein
VKVDNLQAANALTMCVNPFTHSEILVVTSSEWRVYTLGSLELLLAVPCQSLLGLAGGSFLSHVEVMIWGRDGSTTIYRLPDELGR